MSLLGKIARPRNAAPVPYAPRRSPGAGFAFGGQRGTVGPTEDQLKAVTRSGTLFAIIDALSTAVSAPDWALYRKPADGTVDTDDEREPVTKHAAIDVWNTPNPFMTGALLRETVQQHIDLTGEGAILVVKAGALPIELWPVRPDKLTPVPHPTKFLAGWVYTDPDGVKIPFKVDEVLHLRKPSAIDPYRGQSAVDAIGTELEGADLAAQWNRNFFLNSAEPGGIIEVDRRLGDDEFDEMVLRWNEQHKGVQRAHRVAVIEQGKWVGRTISQRDMQFTELRNASRDVLMEAFRVSKTALGITDDVNRASALASEYQFSSKLTVPRLNRWRDMANYQLLPMFGSTGKGVEFDYESPVQDDVETDALDRTSKVNAAVAIMGIPGVKFDVNDVFSAYGLPEIEFEEVEVPVPGMGPDGEPLDPNAPPGEQPGQAPGGQPPAKGDDEKPAQAHAAVRNVAPERDLSQHQAAWERVLARLLDQWDSIGAAQRSELGTQIATAIDDDDLAALADLSVDSATAASRLHESLISISRSAAAQASAEAAEDGAEAPAAPPPEEALGAVAVTVAALLAGGLAISAGREALRRHDGEKTGAQVAAQVKTFLAEQSDASLRTALGGALTGAQNRARADTFKNGPIGSIYATEQLDGNTCVNCRAVDGRFICTTDDQAALYAMYTPFGGYVDCLGGVRCRGAFTGVWRPQTAEDSS